MLVQQVTSGDRTCYVGAVTLSFLKRVFDRPLLLREGVAPSPEKVDKAIDEIAKLIIDRVSRGQTWWMGGFSFVIDPFPSFQPLPSEQHESENSGECGRLRLTETGSEIWTPLDGNQRMLGMFKALSMLSGKERSALSEDMVPVILLPATTHADCQEMLLRMHKSARAVDRGKAIQMTIDDKYARYAHWLMGEDKEHPGVIPKHLINWQSNTLTNRLTKFSTLSVLYDSAQMLDETLVYDEGYNRSDEAHQYNKIANIWSQLLEGFVHFHKAVQAPERLPSLREQFLCLKPTGQLVVVAVIALALRHRVEQPLEQVIERLSALPWQLDDPLWRNIIVVEGRVKGTRPAITLASRLAAHMIGLPLSDAEVRSLDQGYRKESRDENLSLPDPIFPPLG